MDVVFGIALLPQLIFYYMLPIHGLVPLRVAKTWEQIGNNKRRTSSKTHQDGAGRTETNQYDGQPELP